LTAPVYLGIDIGSLAVKVALIDAQGGLMGRAVASAGYDGRQIAEGLVHELLEEQGLAADEVAYAVATGYGRVRFDDANEEVSEITCHALGAFHANPETRTVIDIGGQDSKAMRLDSQGRVVDFAMNDRCAAGTGRFLEVMAAALGVRLEDLGDLALASRHPTVVSNTCTVFAESEAISQMARGAAREDVAAGLHRAIASRVLGLAGRMGLMPDVALTGGVALNRAVCAALEELSGQIFRVPCEPQLMGALGAALFAARKGRRRAQL